MYHFYQGSNIIVSGCSGSGKSTLIQKIIKHANTLFDRKPDKIIFIYNHWQPLYQTIEKDTENMLFTNKIPNEDTLLQMTKDNSTFSNDL